MRGFDFWEFGGLTFFFNMAIGKVEVEIEMFGERRSRYLTLRVDVSRQTFFGS